MDGTTSTAELRVRDEAAMVPPPDETAAARCNQTLMQQFREALEKDPEIDLVSIIPDSYRRMNHEIESEATKLNRRTIKELQNMLRVEPEVDLLSVFPKNYARRMQVATNFNAIPAYHQIKPSEPPEFRTRLDLAETADIIFPLSDTVKTLLAQYSEASNSLEDPRKSLALSLRRMCWDSPKLWENPVRGVVVKCSDEIIAKVVTEDDDYTEYTALQYLAKHAPDIPVPRPHGLVKFEPFCAMFMSYIPSMTLTEAWPKLTHEGKISVQHQLDDIFNRLRAIKQEDGHRLGGLGGEGVKDYRCSEFPHPEIIDTAADFEDFQFSAPHHGSSSYVHFLRSFLSEPARGSVLTHGDVRQDNIMVQMEENGTCVVTGIIDWEDSGFYPEHHESITLTRTLSVRDEDDWYLYLPPCIAPSKFPVRWLVDRLWDIHLKTV
jgi:hypothetical protein